MERRATATDKKKPSVGRVKPMLRGTSADADSRIPSNAATQLTQGNVSQARRSAVAEAEARYTGRSAQIEMLRERIRRYLEQAASLRAEHRRDHVSVENVHNNDEEQDDAVPGVISRMLQNRQSEIVLQNVLQEVLSEVGSKLRQDIENQIRMSRNSNEQKLETLTTRFEDVLRQNQYAHDQEVLELRGSIEYLQETLTATREESERLRQQLDEANFKILERSEDMGCVQAEITDLRQEVQALRAYRDKHRLEMKNLDQLQKQLEDLQTINRLTRQEFTKLEEERDELREEFEKNLLRLRMANQLRNKAIEEQLDDTAEEILF
ncbi:unnamed protein product [Cylicocyclus nassatus]|uniref:Uncharacterized protein n=1 Tax=Cylicocyclus nassatus TaxID=53992 RepID=A0AA36DNJ0_CYLNA|nr:unnamed protein product [Cylicocyclus nassatus]